MRDRRHLTDVATLNARHMASERNRRGRLNNELRVEGEEEEKKGREGVRFGTIESAAASTGI